MRARTHTLATDSQPGWFERLARSFVSWLGKKKQKKKLSHSVHLPRRRDHRKSTSYSRKPWLWWSNAAKKDESMSSTAARRLLEDVRSVNAQEGNSGKPEDVFYWLSKMYFVSVAQSQCLKFEYDPPFPLSRRNFISVDRLTTSSIKSCTWRWRSSWTPGCL